MGRSGGATKASGGGAVAFDERAYHGLVREADELGLLGAGHTPVLVLPDGAWAAPSARAAAEEGGSAMDVEPEDPSTLALSRGVRNLFLGDLDMGGSAMDVADGGEAERQDGALDEGDGAMQLGTAGLGLGGLTDGAVGLVQGAAGAAVEGSTDTVMAEGGGNGGVARVGKKKRRRKGKKQGGSRGGRGRTKPGSKEG